MQTGGECLHDTLLEVLHLLPDQGVIDHHLHLREIFDHRVHVLHAGGNATELLGHTVTHRHPLQLEVFLRELCISDGLYMCSHTTGDLVEFGTGLRTATEVTPREPDTPEFRRGRRGLFDVRCLGLGGHGRYTSLSRSYLRGCLLGLRLTYQLLKQGF